MTTAEKIEAIRKVCIEANPEIAEEYWIHPSDETTMYPPRPVRLADVVYAIRESGRYHLRDEAPEEMKRQFGCEEWEGGTIGDLLLDGWEPLADDLDRQSPETIDWLYSLLCDRKAALMAA